MPRLSRPARARDSSAFVYEPVNHPLTASAQHALRTLDQTHSLKKLHTHIQAANGAITDMAGEINDRLMQKEELLLRRRARTGGSDRTNEQEKQHEEFREQVQGMTAEMEFSTRMLVDVATQMRDVEDALMDVANDAVVRGAAPRWGTNGGNPKSQSRRRRRGDGEEEVEERGDSDEEMLSPEEEEDEDKDAGLMRVFQKSVRMRKEQYDALPKRQKYATNNNYIGFKRILHDALHPGKDAPPVPHPDTWFPSSPPHHRPQSSSSQDPNVSAPSTQGPRNNLTQHGPSNGAAAGTQEQTSDDEIAIAREIISLKCPITLLMFRNPVTSKKCPHSFEQEAIMEMIASSAARVGGRRRGEGEQAVKCPVCEQMITKNDLFVDPLLIRRLKRKQQQELDPEEEDYDDDDDVDNGPSSSGGGGGAAAAAGDGEGVGDGGAGDDAAADPGIENGNDDDGDDDGDDGDDDDGTRNNPQLENGGERNDDDDPDDVMEE